MGPECFVPSCHHPQWQPGSGHPTVAWNVTEVQPCGLRRRSLGEAGTPGAWEPEVAPPPGSSQRRGQCSDTEGVSEMSLACALLPRRSA